MSDKVLSGIYEMKTTLPLFFSKSMLAVSLVCGAVWLAVQPFRLCAMNPEGFDSLQMYRDSIRWSSNNPKSVIRLWGDCPLVSCSMLLA